LRNKRKTETRKPRRLHSEEVQRTFDLLYSRGKTAKEIHNLLQEQWDRGDIPEAPCERKIQYMVKERRIEDSEPWSLAIYEGEGSRQIMDVLASVVRKTQGRRSTLNKSEAEWVLKTSKAVPHENAGTRDEDVSATNYGTKPWLIWLLAQEYLLYNSRGEDTKELDSLIVFAPWSSLWKLKIYERTVKDGCIQTPPLYSVIVHPATLQDDYPHLYICKLHEESILLHTDWRTTDEEGVWRERRILSEEWVAGELIAFGIRQRCEAMKEAQ
jgi:hypothetical protein